jgi:hypothetical protein
MDLHLTVFDVLYRDVVLRKLLLNYASYVEQKVSDVDLATSCFMTLKWRPSNRMAPEDGTEVLTVRAHVPSFCWCEDVYLDGVLRRVQVALNVSTRSGLAHARLLRTSCSVMVIGGATIFKSSTHEISPAAPMCRSLDSQGIYSSHWMNGGSGRT